jgi:hypothetical protein
MDGYVRIHTMCKQYIKQRRISDLGNAHHQAMVPRLEKKEVIHLTLADYDKGTCTPFTQHRGAERASPILNQSLMQAYLNLSNKKGLVVDTSPTKRCIRQRSDKAEKKKERKHACPHWVMYISASNRKLLMSFVAVTLVSYSTN